MVTKIQKVVIEIGEKKIDLSLKEAEELKELLDKLLGKDKEVTIIHEHKYRWPHWDACWDNSANPYTIYCSNNTSGTLTVGGTRVNKC